MSAPRRYHYTQLSRRTAVVKHRIAHQKNLAEALRLRELRAAQQTESPPPK